MRLGRSVLKRTWGIVFQELTPGTCTELKSSEAEWGLFTVNQVEPASPIAQRVKL